MRKTSEGMPLSTPIVPTHRKILSARRKFRKRLATSKSCRKSFWNRCDGKLFHAIASMMAVKIQCNSPRGVRRSLNFPGISSTQSGSTFAMDNCRECNKEQKCDGRPPFQGAYNCDSLFYGSISGDYNWRSASLSIPKTTY